MKFLTPLNLVQQATDPGSASAGDMYFNTSINLIKVYTGTAWVVAGSGSGGGVSVSETPPTGAAVINGSLWFDSLTGQLFVYYSTYWLEVAGGGGGNSAILEVDGGTYDSIAPYNGGTPFTTYYATTISGGTP
jgi:hypothetical protein